jgi:putative tryptophan/tyrosine transport system substrate-binding protein
MQFDRLKRRQFISLLGGAAVAALPIVARAQQGERIRRIGVLMARAAGDPEGQKQAVALRSGLAELGWSSGSVEIELRWPASDALRAEAQAKELVDLRVDVLVANGTPCLLGARQATQSIPIVFVAVADPVAQGFVRSLALPGGTITGFSVEEPSLGAKWVELLREIAPRVVSITVIFNPDTAPFARMFLPSMEAVRRSAFFELIEAPIRSENEVKRAITAAGSRSAPGLIALPDAFLNSHREIIVAVAAEQRLPAIYSLSAFSRSGALIAYGIDRADLFRRAASYVDRILKGAKPADLPVQLPTKFELVINLKTAKALGLQPPPTLLARADEVIE